MRRLEREMPICQSNEGAFRGIVSKIDPQIPDRLHEIAMPSKQPKEPVASSSCPSKTVRICINMDASLREEIRRISYEQRLTMTQIIDSAVREWIERHDR